MDVACVSPVCACGWQCIVDSQQVSLLPEEMLLYDNGDLLDDQTTIQQLIEKNGICTYAVLTQRRPGASPLLGESVSQSACVHRTVANYVNSRCNPRVFFLQTTGTIFPPPSSTNVRLNMSICVVLAAEVRIPNPNDVIEVRGPKDYFCYGEVECDVEPGATIVTFKPRGLYVPAAKYAVRVR